MRNRIVRNMLITLQYNVQTYFVYQVSRPLSNKELLLDGIPGIGAHEQSEIGNLICCRLLFRSSAVANLEPSSIANFFYEACSEVPSNRSTMLSIFQHFRFINNNFSERFTIKHNQSCCFNSINVQNNFIKEEKNLLIQQRKVL